MIDFDKEGQGATEYLLMLAAVLVVVAAAVYYVTSAGGYPSISATAASVDADDTDDNNEIVIQVNSGSIPAGDWSVTIEDNTGSSVTPDSGYNNSKLAATNNIIIAEPEGVANNSYFEITLEHDPTGHVYFSDKKVSI